MEYLQTLLTYLRHFFFYVSDAINTSLMRYGIELKIFSSDVALVVGFVGGFFLRSSILYLNGLGKEKLFYEPISQPRTIDGKTKDEVRRKAKQSL